MIGGSSFVSHMLPAMMALEAGLCDAVLVCYGSNQRTSTVGRAASARCAHCSIRSRTRTRTSR